MKETDSLSFLKFLLTSHFFIVFNHVRKHYYKINT